MSSLWGSPAKVVHPEEEEEVVLLPFCCIAVFLIPEFVDIITMDKILLSDLRNNLFISSSSTT